MKPLVRFHSVTLPAGSACTSTDSDYPGIQPLREENATDRAPFQLTSATFLSHF
jgi:hypothetical protein